MMTKHCVLGLLLLMGLWITPLMAQDNTAAYELALSRIEGSRLSGKTEGRFQDMGLTELPPEIGQLTTLTTLDLSGNRLTSLPPEIGQLNLQSLDLSRNRLTSLPPEIGQLKNLRYLYLDFNQLTSLPPEIGQLAALEVLTLAANDLTSLPTEIGHLPHLQRLDLGGNNNISTNLLQVISWQNVPRMTPYVRAYYAKLHQVALIFAIITGGWIAFIVALWLYHRKR